MRPKLKNGGMLMSELAICNVTLCTVLSKMLGADITNVDYKATKLRGGTLGDVRLVEGAAESVNGNKLPYKVVYKTQEKWERPGDPDSWRREYDLYVSDLGTVLPKSFHWPKCYHTDISGGKIHIWMEYISGISGNNLTIEMLEQASYEIGRFQSKIFSQPKLLKNLTNFGDIGYLKRDYEQWHTQKYSYEHLISEKCPLRDSHKQALKDGRIQLVDGKSYEYSYLRSDECQIPQHLKQMMYNIDDDMEAVFNKISKLPIVLCHRDYWVENIFFADGKIFAIDWDTAGWGYLGEDLASLIADDNDFGNFEEYCQKLIPAYNNGISQHIDIANICDNYVREIILIKFGYRIMRGFMFADDNAKREEALDALQKIFEFDIPKGKL